MKRVRQLRGGMLGLLLGLGVVCVLVGAESCARAQAAVAGGQISGVVEDVQGALIPGAQVVLEDGGKDWQIASGSDGRFVFADVPAGAFTVIAKESGMGDGSAKGTLAAEQQMELEPLMLRASASISVDAMTEEQLATVQVKQELRQRIGGVLPNYFVCYDERPIRLSKKLKFELGWKSVVDPAGIAFVGAVAGMEQAGDSFSGYGSGPAGYGKRLGAGLADMTVGTMLSGSVLPVVFRQDPRYFYKGSGSVRRRALYALRSAVVARGDNGRWQPAYANVLGSFGAGAVSNLYYPAANRGAMLTMENGLVAIGFDGFSNVMQEFLLKHFTPKTDAMGE